MKNIFIVGGDGFARECYFHLKHSADFGKEVNFGGFLGHGGYGSSVDYKEVQKYYKGEILDYKFQDNDYCVIGAGYPELRKKIYEDIKSMGLKFYTLKANIYLSDSFEYGEGNIFVAPFDASVNIKIGNGNLFNGNVIMGHDCKIGDFNTFCPSSRILGNVKVGDSNTIGTNAIILPKAKIGSNNMIAPLSVVYRGCKDDCYMIGNPALKVGEVEKTIK